VEEAKLDTLEWYSRGQVPYNVAGVSSSTFAAGGAAVAACFASPTIWAASTAAFQSSTVPASYLASFLGASFAFASAASVAFAAAGSAVEDAEEDELEWLSRFGGAPRQGMTQGYNPSYGPQYGPFLPGSNALGGMNRQGPFQGRGPMNQQRRGPMMNQQRRGPMMSRRDRFSNDPYSGVVVPTGQGEDIRQVEPRDAEWRESLRGQRYRQRY